MLIFSQRFKYKDPLNVVFLCGSHFNRNNRRDKRIILKDYINSSVPGGCGIILEENFGFAKTSKQYLSYDNIFLTGLAQVEQLASMYANKVIIIHETLSTAAELGMFAINPNLASKICLLVPDSNSIEEEKISGFIGLAFLNKSAPKTKVHVIRYYPDVEIHRFSPNKSDYYCYFHNNVIGPFLATALNDFLKEESAQKTITFSNNRFLSPSQSTHVVDYHISDEHKTVNINTHIDPLKIHLMALLGLEPVRKELRVDVEIREHVATLCEFYKDILRNTIEYITGNNVRGYQVKVSLKGSDCSLRQAVGYFLYMLQATRLIALIQKKDTTPTVRKVQLSAALEKYEKSIHNAVLDIGTTEFGKVM